MSNKKIKYSINGAIIVGLGNGLINLFKQRNNNIDDTPINWWQCLRASLNGALVGGVDTSD